jgi:hypothetical protein
MTKELSDQEREARIRERNKNLDEIFLLRLLNEARAKIATLVEANGRAFEQNAEQQRTIARLAAPPSASSIERETKLINDLNRVGVQRFIDNHYFALAIEAAKNEAHAATVEAAAQIGEQWGIECGERIRALA